MQIWNLVWFTPNIFKENRRNNSWKRHSTLVYYGWKIGFVKHATLRSLFRKKCPSVRAAYYSYSPNRRFSPHTRRFSTLITGRVSAVISGSARVWLISHPGASQRPVRGDLHPHSALTAPLARSVPNRSFFSGKAAGGLLCPLTISIYRVRSSRQNVTYLILWIAPQKWSVIGKKE